MNLAAYDPHFLSTTFDIGVDPHESCVLYIDEIGIP